MKLYTQVSLIMGEETIVTDATLNLINFPSFQVSACVKILQPITIEVTPAKKEDKTIMDNTNTMIINGRWIPYPDENNRYDGNRCIHDKPLWTDCEECKNMERNKIMKKTGKVPYVFNR